MNAQRIGCGILFVLSLLYLLACQGSLDEKDQLFLDTSSPMIAFFADRDGNPEIYTMLLDGTGLTRLTNNPAEDSYPAFSPDGSNQNRLTHTDADEVSSSWSPDGSTILFVGSQSESDEQEICLIDPDGSDWVRVTDNDFNEVAPNWNPASFKDTAIIKRKTQKIVFHSNREGNAEIYSIHADGSNETRLTWDDADDRFPSWSPDGSKVLFQSDRGDVPAIYVMADDGSNVQKIPNTEGGNYAKWSRDGAWIAFFADVAGNTEIVVINADGSHPVNLTNNPSTDETPSWTRDGSLIAFQTDRGGEPRVEEKSGEVRRNFGIYLMNTDGSSQAQVTDFKTNDENPSISPDGKHIVYQSYIDGGLAIVVVNSDGSGKHVLTEALPPCGSPAWSGDGKKIAFDSKRDGNFEIFVMDVDGSNQIQLTFTEGRVENSGASWTQY